MIGHVAKIAVPTDVTQSHSAQKGTTPKIKRDQWGWKGASTNSHIYPL